MANKNNPTQQDNPLTIRILGVESRPPIAEMRGEPVNAIRPSDCRAI
jgi:hypothetical protein